MARGKSVIDVLIIGDAKKLVGAFGDADKATGGLVTSTAKVVGGALLAGKAIDTVFDIGQNALDKADDFNDKLDTLSNLTTPEFAQHIHDVAFSMSELGLSAPEVADAAAAIAAFGKTAGVSEPLIETLTPKLLDVAQAISLKTGKTLDVVIDAIGKAAAGNQKPLRDLGIIVDSTLSPDETITSILAQAVTLYGDAKTAADDLHGTQEKVNAKVDNFLTKLGEALDGPLNGIASIGLEILDELADWPGAIQDILSPLARARDIFGDILGTVGRIASFNINDIFGGGSRPLSESEVRRANQLSLERNSQGRP